MPTSGAFVALALVGPLCWLNTMQASSNTAVTGASQLKGTADGASVRGRRNNRFSIFGDGRRGAQERKRASNSFISFITDSLQTVSKFLQTIAVSAGGSIRRQIEHFSDLLESMLVPDFQHDQL